MLAYTGENEIHHLSSFLLSIDVRLFVLLPQMHFFEKGWEFFYAVSLSFLEHLWYKPKEQVMQI